jgi:hypothetical protein
MGNDPGQSSDKEHKLAREDSLCRWIVIRGKSPRRQILDVLLPTECGANAGGFSLGLTGPWDLGYAECGPDPAGD